MASNCIEISGGVIPAKHIQTPCREIAIQSLHLTYLQEATKRNNFFFIFQSEIEEVSFP